MRTVLYYVLLASVVACCLSRAAPVTSKTTNDNSEERQGGWGSKLLYRDAVVVVDRLHQFLTTLSGFEEMKAGEGEREEEMAHYGLSTRAKKENVGFQMPGWRRRRRSTIEEDLVSAAYFERLDGQSEGMVSAINQFMEDLLKVRQFYEGKDAARTSRQYHIVEPKGLSQVDSEIISHE